MPVKTTGQFGEYIAAAELCRRGFVATTFTRNMPGFDILALNQETNRSLRIQVKTVKRGEWSLDIKRFLEFDKNKFDQGIQKIIGKKKSNETDFFIFVKMGNKGKETFYIIKSEELQNMLHKNYSEFLKKVKGRRPRNPKTTHIAVSEKDLERYKDNWDILQKYSKKP